MPFSGQGLNMACEDSLVLATLISENYDIQNQQFKPKTHFDEMFKEYFDIRHDVTKETQQMANKIGSIQLPSSGLIQGIRNATIQFLSATGLAQHLVDYTATSVERKRIDPIRKRIERYNEA